MAAGDAMIFQTLYALDPAQASNYHSLLEDGPLEVWANAAAAADAWTWDQTQVSTLLRVAGARTSGLGSYFQRISIAAPAASLIGGYLQNVELKGHPLLNGYGHKGQSCSVTMYARNTGAGTATLTLRLAELDAADAVLASSTGSGAVALTSSWQFIGTTRTLNQDDMRSLQINAILTATDTGAQVIELDEATMFFDYTFSRNPSTPDNQGLVIPWRKFQRTKGGRLLRGRPAASIAKFEKNLTFGMVRLTQLEMFRSFYLADSPILWQPNHSHLPSHIMVRIANDFNFTLMRASFSSDLYQGSISLTEI